MRQWVLVITALTAAVPQAAFALGLGEIRLLSALHEPLRAEIEIISARPEEFDRLNVVMASSEAFARIGIDRPFFLSQFRFRPVVKENGKAVVQVSSDDPVREPFLDFLVQADWPGGRLSREYTVLVNPPSTQRKRGAAPVFDAPEISLAPPTESVVSDGGTVNVTLASEYGPTQSGDTLWKIAQRVAGAASTSQMMNALVQANPQAFVNGDPNRLRTGQTLRVPDAEGMRVLASAPEGGVNFQAATGSVAATPVQAPTGRAEQDQLRIVGATDTAGTSATGTPVAASEEVAKLQRALTLASEDKAVLNKQNTELSTKLTDLEDQLSKLQGMLTARNDELARLQQQAATLPADTTTPPVAVVDTTPPVAVVDTTPPVAVVDTTPPVAAVDTTPPVAVVDTTPPVAAVDTTPPVAAVDTTPPVAAVDTTPPVAAVDTTPPTTLPDEKAAPSGNLLGLPRLAWLGIGVLGLAGFVGGLLFLLRRSPSETTAPDFTRTSRRKPDDDMEDENAAADFIEGASEPNKHEDTSFLSDFTPSDIEAIQNEASAVVDPLSEADVYIAYQRYQQVEDLLKLAIAETPNRVELHLKLLEVYTATKNTAGFEKTAEQVAQISGKSSPAWERVVAMGKGWLPSYSKVLGGAGSPPTGDSEMAFLTQPAAAAPTAGPAGAKAAPEPEAEQDSGMNFDFDLDTWLKEQQAGTQAAAPADEDTQSSGLDFTLTPPEQKAKPAATTPAPAVTPNDDLAPLDFGAVEPVAKPTAPLADESELTLPTLDTSSEMDLFDDVGTKLELARAYVEMGDAEGARSLLSEVLAEGSGAQKQEAQEMLAQLK